jgi:hypothetical protein
MEVIPAYYKRRFVKPEEIEFFTPEYGYHKRNPRVPNYGVSSRKIGKLASEIPWPDGVEEDMERLMARKARYEVVPVLNTRPSATDYLISQGLNPDDFTYFDKDLDNDPLTPDDLIIKHKKTNKVYSIGKYKPLPYTRLDKEKENLRRAYFEEFPSKEMRKEHGYGTWVKDIKPDEFKNVNQKLDKQISKCFDQIIKTADTYHSNLDFRPSQVVIRKEDTMYKFTGMQYMNLLQGLGRAWKYMYVVPLAIEQCNDKESKRALKEAWSYPKYTTDTDDKTAWDKFIEESNEEIRVVESKLYNNLMIAVKNINEKILKDELSVLIDFIIMFYRHVFQAWCEAYPEDITFEDREALKEYPILPINPHGIPSAPLTSVSLKKASDKRKVSKSQLAVAIAEHEKQLKALYGARQKEKEKEKESYSSSSSSSLSTSSSLSSPSFSLGTTSRSILKRKKGKKTVSSSPMEIESDTERELE